MSSCTATAVHVHREYASVQRQSRHFLPRQTFISNKKYRCDNGNMSHIKMYTMIYHKSTTIVAHLLFIFPLSLAVMEESSGASGECKSACARLCCSKLYSLSSASNVPERKQIYFKNVINYFLRIRQLTVNRCNCLVLTNLFTKSVT